MAESPARAPDDDAPVSPNRFVLDGECVRWSALDVYIMASSLVNARAPAESRLRVWEAEAVVAQDDSLCGMCLRRIKFPNYKPYKAYCGQACRAARDKVRRSHKRAVAKALNVTPKSRLEGAASD
jgi:hypothetical protein